MSNSAKPHGGRRWRRSTVVPLMLTAYLAVMSYIGRGELAQGHYLYYFSIVGITLCAIVALHFTLKRKEKRQE